MSNKEKKAAAAAEQAKKDKKFKRNAIIVVVVFALLVAAALVINSNLLYTSTTAVEIGGTKYSPAEYNYYYYSVYNNAYNEIYSQYGDMASYILDTSKPLSEQVYLFGDGEMTWHDYISEQALLEMTNLTILYDAAVKAGYTLSAEDQETIDAAVANLEVTAAGYGFGSVDSFLAANYGKGVDTELFIEMAEKQSIATAYSTDLNDSFSYTADELEAYYAENKDAFDFVKYHMYFVGTSNANFTELSDEEKAAAAKEAAETIALATTPAEFAENVYNFVAEDSKSSYEDESATLNISQGGNISDTYSQWLLSADRAEGDTTVIEIEGGAYAIMFVSRNDNHYNTVSARHILIQAEADDNGEYTEEALAIAKEKLEEIYAAWQEDPTEENFAALAEQYSEDSGSSANGGLYEEIFQDYMVEEFDAFLFDEHHMPGDTGIVYGSNGYYAGYHLIYYVGEGDVYSDILAESDLRSSDYNEAVTALAEGYDYETGFGMRFVG